MFGKRYPLLTLWGFPVYVDVSWLLLVAFFTWTLASGYFPFHYAGFTGAQYFLMGLIATLGLVGSVILHECCHALVARHYGLPMGGITLFIFGGVAEMTEEPKTPKVEFLMALAGPVASILLGFGFYFLAAIAQMQQAPIPIQAVLEYLGLINMVLAIFNMIPAFPLDGGRVLRAVLWKIKGDVDPATRIAARIGGWFGTTLLFLGVLSIFFGNPIGGIWWVLIGLFLKNAATMGYQQVEMRHELADIQVRNLMKKDFIGIPPSLTLRQAVDDYFYRYFDRDFPVIEDNQLYGTISLSKIREKPKRFWPSSIVADVMRPAITSSVISADASAMEAMDQIQQSKLPHLIVVDRDGTLAGILTSKDLLRYMSMRRELEKAS